MTGPPVDRGDIQGDILRAYGNDYDCTSYVFISVGDAAEGRAWLKEVAQRVSSDESWTGPKPKTHLNVAFTYQGLLALGVPERVAETFSEEFKQGMAGRASLLGDLGESDPDHWDGDLGTGAAHAMLTVNGQTPEQTRLSWSGSTKRLRPRASRSCTRSTPRCSKARVSTSATPTASPSRRSRASTRSAPTAEAYQCPVAAGDRWPWASSSSAIPT